MTAKIIISYSSIVISSSLLLLWLQRLLMRKMSRATLRTVTTSVDIQLVHVGTPLPFHIMILQVIFMVINFIALAVVDK